MNTFRLLIAATDKKFYDGDCVSLIIPTAEGFFGIQAHHSNMITSLEPGILTFERPDGKRQIAVVSHGFVEVCNNTATILCATIERREDIDEARARKSLEDAQRKMRHIQNAENYMSAVARASRARARLNALTKFKQKK